MMFETRHQALGEGVCHVVWLSVQVLRDISGVLRANSAGTAAGNASKLVN